MIWKLAFKFSMMCGAFDWWVRLKTIDHNSDHVIPTVQWDWSFFHVVIVYQRFFPKNAAHMISQAKLIGSNTVEVPEQTFECDALKAVMDFIFEFLPSHSWWFTSYEIYVALLDPLPMRLRAFPQSFWQQPNQPVGVSPAHCHKVLPPLSMKDEIGMCSTLTFINIRNIYCYKYKNNNTYM